MPIFKFRGKNKIGSIVEGERRGRNSNSASDGFPLNPHNYKLGTFTHCIY